MRLTELFNVCREAVERRGGSLGKVSFVVPPPKRFRGQRKVKPLGPRSPLADVMGSTHDGKLIVFMNAAEVLRWVEKLIEREERNNDT